MTSTKTNKYLVLTILFVLLMSCRLSLTAQTVYGRVTSVDGGPLEYVNVGVLSSNGSVGTVTDSKGRYEIVLPTTDSVTLRFSLTGYSIQQHRIKVLKGMMLSLDCEMLPSTTRLQEVTIEDDKVRKTTFTQIDVQKIENSVGPSDGVESLIKTLPDVASNNELSSQYSVRGGSFDENLVYINGVEVYRPILVRCGEQEGLSIINPDMVDNVMFSPGGFDVTYGDRMSSVLDITYNRPTCFKEKVSGSLLGGSAWAQGLVAEKLAYSVGVRHHSNKYVLGSLDTKGDYTTDYTDFQAILDYKFSEKCNLSFLGVWTHNNYALTPHNRSTDFGTFNQQLHLDVYFDGEEADSYNTLLSALTLDYHPNDKWNIKAIASIQGSTERETYDIQSQYWLREVVVGTQDTMFDRGVGTFLEHARNSLQTHIYSAELKATRFATLGNWNMGLKFHYEDVSDRIREWKWVDSAGYTFPTNLGEPGNIDNMPQNPILQLYCNSRNGLSTNRLSGYLQRSLVFYTRHDHEISLLIGARGQYYNTDFIEANTQPKSKLLISPRLSLNYQPNWKQDMLFRLTTGIYHQPPFYREYRYDDGSINPMLEAQHSYQVMGTFDWNFKAWTMPFRLTADLYYKYITNLVPYTIENLRIRYDAENSAVGYATGLSVRINGELVKGLESWASLSIMKSEQDVLNDNLSWYARPTDQRFSFKVFLQDNVPNMEYWRMSLSLIATSGMTCTYPYQTDFSVIRRLPMYYRVDWGNTIQLSQFPSLKSKRLFQKVDDILLSLEVFNLFNYHNVVSYLWVSDINNIYSAVPNYLTARQLNLKVTVTF